MVEVGAGVGYDAPMRIARVACCLVLCACGDEAARARASASARASTSAPASATGADEPPAPPPGDLDPGPLRKALKCESGATSGPCGVLDKLSTCKPWSAVAPSGEGRWLGQGHVVERGKAARQVTVMRARRVPTSEVASGQLPTKIALDQIEKKEGVAYEMADRAIRILERQDVAPRFNATLDHMKTRTEWTESFAARTAGGHVYIASHGGGFACEGEKRQILLVRRADQRATGDGLYAELWPTSW
jgi:hypothetical protein